MSDIKEILELEGYEVKDFGSYYKCAGLWRGGSDLNSITIYKNNGAAIDHVSGEKYSHTRLISLILNIPEKDKLEEYLSNKNFNFTPKNDIQEPLIKSVKIFPDELNLLQEKHDYLLGRGISLETAKQFKAGLFSGQNNKLKDRYTWVIFNSKKQIIGYTGRDLTGFKKNKHKHLGTKKEWCWPCYLNIKDIQEKSEVIIVESPIDIESLFEAGIRNCVCSFGIELNFALVNLFLRLNLKSIIIAINNEPDNKNIGNNAAIKMERKLLRYFDKKTVKIHLPPIKDFNLLLTTQNKDAIIKWYENRK